MRELIESRIKTKKERREKKLNHSKDFDTKINFVFFVASYALDHITGPLCSWVLL